jgi:hypothetical protein
MEYDEKAKFDAIVAAVANNLTHLDDIIAAIEAAAAITITPATLSNANDDVASGYYAATELHLIDADLVATNIKTGVTIFGVVGTYDTEAVSPAAAGDIATGKIAFVNGAKITGTL